LVEDAEPVEEAWGWRRRDGGEAARPAARQIYRGAMSTARAQVLSSGGDDDESRLGFAVTFRLVIPK
jgi:hypothetical protein